MEDINGHKGTRTMLIIARRLHTIENCDMIYEVKDGKVEKKEGMGEKTMKLKSIDIAHEQLFIHARNF